MAHETCAVCVVYAVCEGETRGNAGPWRTPSGDRMLPNLTTLIRGVQACGLHLILKNWIGVSLVQKAKRFIVALLYMRHTRCQDFLYKKNNRPEARTGVTQAEDMDAPPSSLI